MKKSKQNKKVFNTIYKKGEKLFCIKDLVWNEQILFHQGETRTIDHIEYGHCGYPNNTTIYDPYYIIKRGKDGYCFTSNEEFTTDEKSSGASGKSGYGCINDYWKKIE